jgi:hypothetical protein
MGAQLFGVTLTDKEATSPLAPILIEQALTLGLAKLEAMGRLEGHNLQTVDVELMRW